MKLAVAGCGRMGAGMARALHNAGHDTVGYDIAPTSLPFMVTRDGLIDRDVIFTVVRDVAQTDDLLFDDQAIVTLPNLKYLVICSTLSPRYVAELRHRVPTRIALIDAPMSGAQIAADQARLSFMLGGDPTDLDVLSPYFDAMGRVSHRMGPYGAGATAKVLNNLVAASSMAATRNALKWAHELGLERNKLLALMHDSSGQTWLGSNFGTIEFAPHGWEPDNTIAILEKDVASAIDGAPEGANLDFARAVMHAMRTMESLD